MFNNILIFGLFLAGLIAITADDYWLIAILWSYPAGSAAGTAIANIIKNQK